MGHQRASLDDGMDSQVVKRSGTGVGGFPFTDLVELPNGDL